MSWACTRALRRGWWNWSNRFASSIHLSHGSRRVNGKSIMGVLMLAAAKGSSNGLEAGGPTRLKRYWRWLALSRRFWGEL